MVGLKTLIIDVPLYLYCNLILRVLVPGYCYILYTVQYLYRGMIQVLVSMAKPRLSRSERSQDLFFSSFFNVVLVPGALVVPVVRSTEVCGTSVVQGYLYCTH